MQNINLNKDLDLGCDIDDLLLISIDDQIDTINDKDGIKVEGKINISGRVKSNNIEKDFFDTLDLDIFFAYDEILDRGNLNVSVSDFNYKIENKKLNLDISIKIDGLKEIENTFLSEETNEFVLEKTIVDEEKRVYIDENIEINKDEEIERVLVEKAIEIGESCENLESTTIEKQEVDERNIDQEEKNKIDIEDNIEKEENIEDSVINEEIENNKSDSEKEIIIEESINENRIISNKDNKENNIEDNKNITSDAEIILDKIDVVEENRNVSVEEIINEEIDYMIEEEIISDNSDLQNKEVVEKKSLLKSIFSSKRIKEEVSWKLHCVKGETNYEEIAAKYNVNLDSLIAINKNEKLVNGKLIFLPLE